ncbi:MAG: DUF3833 domain-containing protein [Rickettsiales bacterium]|nr:DUF3833 domain-containing protein [Rickettsiales bacterium]
MAKIINPRIILTFMTLSFLFGCSSAIDPKIYVDNSPKFDIRQYLNGDLEAQGILQDRSGKVIKSFTVKMRGNWVGNAGQLEENFVFSDGKKDQRTWKINMIDDNNFTAKAHDTVGIATGQQFGNAMKMNYVLSVDVDGKKYDIKLVDWIFLVDEKTAINVSRMSKFGFNVGTLTISFKKL